MVDDVYTRYRSVASNKAITLIWSRVGHDMKQRRISNPLVAKQYLMKIRVFNGQNSGLNVIVLLVCIKDFRADFRAATQPIRTKNISFRTRFR